jgi:hypothetical protein
VALPLTVLDRANITVGPDGRCFATQVIAPPVMQTVTEQVQIVPAQLDASGAVTSPPVFRNQQVERIATPAQEQSFETLCPPAFTAEFSSSLQRALLARDAYLGAVTGTYDEATGAAVQLYQSPTGPNSPILAVQTARDLGLVSLSAAQINALDGDTQ